MGGLPNLSALPHPRGPDTAKFFSNLQLASYGFICVEAGQGSKPTTGETEAEPLFSCNADKRYIHTYNDDPPVSRFPLFAGPSLCFLIFDS
ncbi:hypothetical protein NXS19_007477 [Fusarium pseudograminearum]|nr:hypothetical protein NXS19_007477 [Fusarium pseudograminearum]